MSRPTPLRIVSRAGLFPSLTRLDWIALYLATASVLLFALAMVIGGAHGVSALGAFRQESWARGHGGEIVLNRVLLIFLMLEVVVLAWLWLDFPSKRNAENELRKMHSLQRAIARASARIVTMAPAEMERGLKKELAGIREMLGVDRICWYQQTEDGRRFLRLQTAGVTPSVPEYDWFSKEEHPWLAQCILSGVPARVRSLEEMPGGAERDRERMERIGIKSFALAPASSGGGATNALMLASFVKETDWDPEVVAQLSVLASVFAQAQARKLAQDEGTKSALRFRHLFEEAPIGCCLVDLQGYICAANAAAKRMLGYSDKELTRRTLWEIAAAEDTCRSLAYFQELAAGARDFYQSEERCVRKDGATIWGRLTVSVLGARPEERQFVLAMIEDVTEAVRAREQLEESRRRLTMALEASRMTAWDYDPAAGTISWVDRHSLQQPEGKPAGPAPFAEVLQNVHPDDRTMLLELARRIMKEGGAFSAEFRMFGRDGSIQWRLGKGELLREGGASGGRIVGVTLDVSELKRTQIELQELAKRLMEAQEEERKRISRELHDDIGQRVALLAIELDLVRQDLSGQEKLRERVERAQAATLELGTDLHQLSHALHSSKLEYLGLPAALRELCSRIAEKHGLAVRLEGGEEKFALGEEDALALFRVAQEALNNVVRHSHATQANVVLSHTAQEVRLAVCDDGQGFDTASRTSGIGLIGMRERLRAVGGEFQIKSTPGGSTEVHATVTLPATARQGPKVKQVRAGSLQ